MIETATTSARPGGAGLGLEVELFPVMAGPRLRRVPFAGADGLLEQLASTRTGIVDDGETIAEAGWWSGAPDGCRVSFEPGGQIEVSTCYQPRPAVAMSSADRTLGRLAAAAGQGDITLAAAGIDVWAPGTVPQQLAAPRYPAMDRYLAERGRAGRTMMRDTCSLQLNLDLGAGGEAASRWLASNLVAPVATATFACSPSRDGRWRSRRSRTWQRVDPTRTGFPPGVTDERAGLADELERFAMDADVLLVDDGRTTLPGRPGWRFRDWMAGGHPRLGWPAIDDLEAHLTTLFPEVRPRGYLEIRSIDSPPTRWRRAVAALYLGAIYDPHARDRIVDVLLRRPGSLGDQLHRATVQGVADPTWCALAVEVWSFALEGATRLPAGALDPADLAIAERFLDHFTLRGRCPADDLLRELHRGGPEAALAWSAEPVAMTQEARS